MAGISATQLKDELGAYFRKHSEEMKSMFYHSTNELSPYLRTITKVKGRFPAPHTVTDDVVQAFRAQWDAMGTTHFKANDLVDYHLKVNFPIVPADILGSYLAFLYQENLKKEQMPISKYVLEQELKLKMKENIAEVMVKGEYQNGVYGNLLASMNGLLKILADGIASSDKPMYKIPLPAFTDDNAVDVITTFERNIPEKLKTKVDTIFISWKNYERYILDYENTFGANNNYGDDRKVKTRINQYKLQPLSHMGDSDFIFATPKGNMLKLVDIFDQPMVNDVQVDDYTVKIFGEGWLGINFWINQLVLVGVNIGSGSGLTTDNALYYND